ncbi:MAG TPA: hypothetical protein VGC34_04925 [Steroidobacteraceae bacterium]
MPLPRNNWKARLAGSLRALGPYAAIELLLPGGSLIALSVWAVRNRSSIAARARRVLVRETPGIRPDPLPDQDPQAAIPTRSLVFSAAPADELLDPAKLKVAA